MMNRRALVYWLMAISTALPSAAFSTEPHSFEQLRDPFSGSERERSPVNDCVSVTTTPPSAIVLKWAGIVTTPSRTQAILELADGQLVSVGEGEVLASRWKIAAIDPQQLELVLVNVTATECGEQAIILEFGG
ncbi:hypothetical protein [Vibrio sinaloensis]|uniref:hypothetical protein n=1 Tax=Photobacterium sp. (strain ATCC 43367) TaxID=379097 RepID=UPI00206B44F3|nr:hypothetical protein [Vibrio sinaloensis]UPQ88182.1 hypothetical protein MTO69_01040 [Vibrio sinaloensis]